jgi:oligopeptidase B
MLLHVHLSTDRRGARPVGPDGTPLMRDGPPVAKRVPAARTHHGDTITEEYGWLADLEDPDTKAHLAAENAYTEAATAHLAGLRDRIFQEIRDRTQESDLSVPVRIGHYWYYTRTVADRQYPVYCRRPVGPGEVDPPDPTAGEQTAGEQTVLDANQLAEGHDFLDVGTFELSPDGRLLAYSVDHTGGERFTLRIRDLAGGEVLPDEIPDTSYGSAWSLDATMLFYLKVDATGRPHQVWRHRLGSPVAGDQLVYQEADARFGVSVALGRSRRFIQIEARSATTSEVRLLPADEPTAQPRVVAARRPGVDYRVQHDATGGRLLVLHNDRADDFALAWTPDDAPGEWRPLLPHTPGVRLEGVDAFATCLAVSLRREGLTAVRVVPLEPDGEPYDIAFPEPVYRVGLENNAEYRTPWLRLRYASLSTPDSVYDYHLDERTMVLRKRLPVRGGFRPDRYTQRREWARAADGTAVPVSLVYRADALSGGPAPCVLSGYGAYGRSIEPWFETARLSLLDRGLVFAIAHVRGGGELGRPWHDQGRLLAKKNTFTDFLACARRLVDLGIADPDRMVAHGRSAGGLLMGVVANLAPEMFSGIVAEMPFVDPLRTMLDPSLPLTVTEWEEWGNPLDSPEVYHYLKSYSPYENVARRPYPPILVMTSLNDARVRYVEAAKWVARLRSVAPGRAYLLRTETRAGHQGVSGRHETWRQEAFVQAWILDRLGVTG